MITDKLKIEKDQNTQIRNQVAQLLQLEQEQKLQIQQRDSTIQMLQVSCFYTIAFFSLSHVSGIT